MIEPNPPWIELHIPRWHPATLNKLVRNYQQASRLKGLDRQMIAVHYMPYPACGETKRRVTLTITLQPGKRAPDPDAYWKSTLDGLVKCGALKNDSHKWVMLAPVIYVRGTDTDWGTDIVLEDMNA
jgi:hypothetical protein